MSLLSHDAPRDLRTPTSHDFPFDPGRHDPYLVSGTRCRTPSLLGHPVSTARRVVHSPPSISGVGRFVSEECPRDPITGSSLVSRRRVVVCTESLLSRTRGLVRKILRSRRDTVPVPKDLRWRNSLGLEQRLNKTNQIKTGVGSGGTTGSRQGPRVQVSLTESLSRPPSRMSSSRRHHLSPRAEGGVVRM